MITLQNITHKGEYVVTKSDKPLRTFSSAMHNAGYGEYTVFLNRTVDKSYNPENSHLEMQQYIESKGYQLDETVAMMTAVDVKLACSNMYEDGDTSIVILVTAGLGNAVDVTKSHLHKWTYSPGTINIFIFINGKVTDEALIQGLCCAVEVKSKILMERNVLDPNSNTIATGTSTDSVCIAATQEGEFHEYAGSITRLGSLIGKGLYETLSIAVDEYLQFIEEERN